MDKQKERTSGKYVGGGKKKRGREKRSVADLLTQRKTIEKEKQI